MEGMLRLRSYRTVFPLKDDPRGAVFPYVSFLSKADCIDTETCIDTDADSAQPDLQLPFNNAAGPQRLKELCGRGGKHRALEPETRFKSQHYSGCVICFSSTE